MIVHVPSQLESYTSGARQVEAQGATLAEVLADLDSRFPGFRFRLVDEQDRIRTHMRVFVGGTLTRTLDCAVGERDEVYIAGALSGG